MIVVNVRETGKSCIVAQNFVGPHICIFIHWDDKKIVLGIVFICIDCIKLPHWWYSYSLREREREYFLFDSVTGFFSWINVAFHFLLILPNFEAAAIISTHVPKLIVVCMKQIIILLLFSLIIKVISDFYPVMRIEMLHLLNCYRFSLITLFTAH